MQRFSVEVVRLFRRIIQVSPTHVVTDMVVLCGIAFLCGIPFPPQYSEILGWLLLSHFVCFALGGGYEIIWRYFSFHDAGLIFKTSLLTAFTNIVVIAGITQRPVSIWQLLTFSFVGSVATISLRVFRRYLHEYPSLAALKSRAHPVLLFGAGDEGRLLAQRMVSDRKLNERPIGFVDDTPEKQNRVIAGLRVLGKTEDLENILKATKCRSLIITTRKLSQEKLMEVVRIASRLSVKTQILKLSNAANHKDHDTPQLCDIEFNDLLHRPKKDLNTADLHALIAGKRILVTGAGGSIGSELVRQILALQPEKLLMLDHSEYNLYEIDRDVASKRNFPQQTVPLLIDIKNYAALEQVFEKYRPQLVFHAAAYKHVHLVESNPYSAILNNVLGTQNLIKLSDEYAVDSFVLISTDKAVRPGGIMGATKRACELMIAEAKKTSSTRFAAVRFGNVLGSSGSLIPLLHKQVEAGGPVTITHPEMKRYFMLIPEAVSLVLKASRLAESGDIMVLRMGEPVKIVDVAKSLIALMGKSEEIPIVFTGIRPGEKLFEELYLTGEELITDDPDILVIPDGDTALRPHLIAGNYLTTQVAQMIEFAFKGNRKALEILSVLVDKPTNDAMVEPGSAPIEERVTFPIGVSKTPSTTTLHN